MCGGGSPPPPPPPPVYIPPPPANDNMEQILNELQMQNQQMQNQIQEMQTAQVEQVYTPPPPPVVLTSSSGGSKPQPQTAVDPATTANMGDEGLYARKKKGRKSLKIRRTNQSGGGSGLNIPS